MSKASTAASSIMGALQQADYIEHGTPQISQPHTTFPWPITEDHMLPWGFKHSEPHIHNRSVQGFLSLTNKGFQ